MLFSSDTTINLFLKSRMKPSLVPMKTVMKKDIFWETRLLEQIALHMLVLLLVASLPARNKKTDATKKASKYDNSASKNKESVQRITMLKMQSEAQITISQS